jgi:hypothetical protein
VLELEVATGTAVSLHLRNDGGGSALRSGKGHAPIQFSG